MEKDGWLDQALMATLTFLNQTWLSITVALMGGFLVAFLARRAPGEDWAYIKDGPGNLLTGAFLLLAGLKSVPHFVLPKTSFACDTTPGPLGIPTNSNCRMVSEGTAHYEVGYTFGNFFRDIGVSLLIDLIYGGLGVLLGIAVATLVKHLADPPPPA